MVKKMEVSQIVFWQYYEEFVIGDVYDLEELLPNQTISGLRFLQ